MPRVKFPSDSGVSTTEPTDVAAEVPAVPRARASASLSAKAAEMVAQRVEVMEVADQLVEHAARGGELSDAEMTLLASVGIDRKTLDSRVRVAKRRIHQQAIAGSGAERAAACSAADEARARLEGEGSRLLREIADLQARHEGLVSEVKVADQRVATQQAAVAALRDPKMLAPHHREAFDRLRRQYNEKVRSRFAGLEAELAETAVVERLDFDLQKQSVLLAAERVADKYRDLVVGVPSSMPPSPRAVVASEWQRYIADRKAADVVRRQRIAAIEAEPEAVELRTAMEKILSRYVPE